MGPLQGGGGGRAVRRVTKAFMRGLHRWMVRALRGLSWREGRAFTEEIRAHYRDAFVGCRMVFRKAKRRSE